MTWDPCVCGSVCGLSHWLWGFVNLCVCVCMCSPACVLCAMKTSTCVSLMSCRCMPNFLVSTSLTMPNPTGEKGHSCFLSDFREKVFGLFTISMMSAVCFSLMPYFRMMKFPSVHSYWLSSLSRVVEYFQISFCTYWDDLVVFGICSINSILLIGCYLNSSSDIRPTFLSWVNFTGSCCIGHFIFLDSVCQYFVEAFASILKRRIWVLYYKVLYSVKLLLYIVCICEYICMYIFIKCRNSIYSVCGVFVQYW